MVDFAPHAQALMEVHGVAAVYTPPAGDPVSCRVQIVRNVALPPGSEFESCVSEARTMLTFLVSELGGPPRRGGVAVVGEETFTVDRLLDHDGYLARALVVPGVVPGYVPGEDGPVWPWPEDDDRKPPEAPDGVRSNFSTAAQFRAGSLWVWLNGVLQDPATQYAEDPDRRGYTFTVPPHAGDVILHHYTRQT